MLFQSLLFGGLIHISQMSSMIHTNEVFRSEKDSNFHISQHIHDFKAMINLRRLLSTSKDLKHIYKLVLKESQDWMQAHWREYLNYSIQQSIFKDEMSKWIL